MTLQTIPRNIAGRIIHYSALILIAYVFGSFYLGQRSNCFAQQNITVKPGANLQALVNRARYVKRILPANGGV